MSIKTIPLVPWDPNNNSGLVAWSCDCLSEASITAAGGSWNGSAPHEFDPVKGTRVTAYAAASRLLFNLVGKIPDTENVGLGFQLSCEIETSQLIGYYASNIYQQGVNASTGSQRFIDAYYSGVNSNGISLDLREASFSEISGLNVSGGYHTGNNELYAGSVSSYKKNFHTRLILVGFGQIWQLWAEHQDADGNRIGLSCLTRSGLQMSSALLKHKMYYRNVSATPHYPMQQLSFIWSVFGATRTALNTYLRNIQLVPYAPTQISHPLLRTIISMGDSYGGPFSYPDNAPNPANTNTGICGGAIFGSDSHPFERAMARIVNDTGVNVYSNLGGHYGGSTLINCYTANRSFGGTPNPRRPYLLSDNAVPAATIWSNSMAVNAGDFIRPITRNGYVYSVTTSDGNAGVTEPTWPTTINNTVTLDGVTYQCRDYDQDYSESGILRKGFAKPSLMLHIGGFNDADFIQRNIDSPGTVTVWPGYSYATYAEMYEDLWKKWMKALLDQNKQMKVCIFTVPASAPAAIYVNGIATATGRTQALAAINAVYLAAPAYFAALGSSYQGRVVTVDFKSMGGWNAIGDHSEDYADGTHPFSERSYEIFANAMYKGIRYLMTGNSNTVLN